MAAALGGATERAAHATLSDVVRQPSLGCREAQAPLGDCSPLSAGRPVILGVPSAPVSGITAGTSDEMHPLRGGEGLAWEEQ